MTTKFLSTDKILQYHFVILLDLGLHAQYMKCGGNWKMNVFKYEDVPFDEFIFVKVVSLKFLH